VGRKAGTTTLRTGRAAAALRPRWAVAAAGQAEAAPPPARASSRAGR